MSTVPSVSSDLGARAARALQDVAAAAGRSSDVTELGRIVVDRARLITGGSAAILRWFDPASRRLSLVASVGVIGDPQAEVDVDAPTGLREAFNTGRPVIVNDYPSTGRTTEWGRRHTVHAYISVPLLLEGKPVGTLVVISQQPHEYRQDDAVFLTLIAAMVAPALESARLNDEVLRHKRVLQEVYEALPIAVIVFDGEGKVVYSNRATEDMVGAEVLARIRDRTLPLYNGDGRLMTPEERPTARALTSRQPVRGTIVGFDEPRRWGYLDVVPILSPSGQVESMVSSMVEVTSLIAVETALRESDELFSGAFQASGAGMTLTDADRSILRANPSLCRLLGYSESQLAGVDALTMFADEDAARVQAMVAGLESAPGPPVAVMDLRARHREGHHIWARLTASLVRSDAGPRYVLLQFIDITEERKAQAILRSEQERLGVIIEAQRDIAGKEPDIDRLVAALTQHAATLVQEGSAVVMFPRGDELVVHSAAGNPPMRVGYAIPIESSVSGLAYRTRTIQRVSDAREDHRAHTATARLAGIGAIVAAPLMSGDDAIGVLQLMSPQRDGLDETDVRTVEMVAGFAASAFDRAATAQRLQLSERRVRAILETAPDPIVLLDSDGLIVGFNPAAERAFTYEQVEVVGRSGLSLLAPRHTESFERFITAGRQARLDDYAGRYFEATARRSDGTEFPIEISVAEVPEEMRLTAVFIRDLTLRERLSESRERLAAVVASAPVIVFACDADGVITLVEGKGLVNLGLDAETLRGRSLADVIAYQPDGLDLLQQALHGETVSGEFHLMQPDAYLEGNLGPITDTGGNVIGASGVVTDVTDRVRADIAQREADAKSRLMAMMNHEVRTPLNSILGFAHLLTDRRTGQLTEQQRRFVDNIQVSGKELLTLVNESLDLARLESGAGRLELTEFPAYVAIERSVDQVRPMAESRGVTLDVVVQRGEDSVRADAGSLVQVLLNLLTNGIRHTPEHGKVTIEAKRHGKRLIITVTDTGAGIAPEYIGRIFEEFYQAPNHGEGGIGLGLAISRRLAELMGGTIEVESELGRGSRFTLDLAAANRPIG